MAIPFSFSACGSDVASSPRSESGIRERNTPSVPLLQTNAVHVEDPARRAFAREMMLFGSPWAIVASVGSRGDTRYIGFRTPLLTKERAVFTKGCFSIWNIDLNICGSSLRYIMWNVRVI